MNYSQIFKKHLELSLLQKDYFLIHDENIRYHLNRVKDLNAETFLDAIHLQSDEKYSGYRNQTLNCFIGLSMFNLNYNNPYEEIRIVQHPREKIVVERHLCIPLLYHNRKTLLKNLDLSDALKDYSIYRFRINDKTSDYIFPLIKKGYVLKTDNTFELSDGKLRLSIHDIFGTIKIVSTELTMIIRKSLSRRMTILPKSIPYDTKRSKTLTFTIQYNNATFKHIVTKVNTNPFVNAMINCLNATRRQEFDTTTVKERVKRVYKPLQRPSLISMKKKLTQYAILPSIFFLITLTINSIMFIVLLVIVIRAQYKL